jgi:hypothetical protein
VIASSDAIPPFAGVFDDPELLKPSAHTNEWDFHRHFVDVWKDGQTCSPDESQFLVGGGSSAAFGKGMQAWSSGHSDSEEAWKIAADMIQTELKISTHRRPDWKKEYDRLVLFQKQIDELKASGKKIPLALIENQFIRQYERDHGAKE